MLYIGRCVNKRFFFDEDYETLTTESQLPSVSIDQKVLYNIQLASARGVQLTDYFIDDSYKVTVLCNVGYETGVLYTEPLLEITEDMINLENTWIVDSPKTPKLSDGQITFTGTISQDSVRDVIGFEPIIRTVMEISVYDLEGAKVDVFSFVLYLRNTLEGSI